MEETKETDPSACGGSSNEAKSQGTGFSRAVCKKYLQGYCVYGASCKFKHDYSKITELHQIAAMMDAQAATLRVVYQQLDLILNGTLNRNNPESIINRLDRLESRGRSRERSTSRQTMRSRSLSINHIRPQL